MVFWKNYWGSYYGPKIYENSHGMRIWTKYCENLQNHENWQKVEEWKKIPKCRRCPIARCGNIATPDNRYSSSSCPRITLEFVSRCTGRRDVDTTSIMTESGAAVNQSIKTDSPNFVLIEIDFLNIQLLPRREKRKVWCCHGLDNCQRWRNCTGRRSTSRCWWSISRQRRSVCHGVAALVACGSELA